MTDNERDAFNAEIDRLRKVIDELLEDAAGRTPMRFVDGGIEISGNWIVSRMVQAWHEFFQKHGGDNYVQQEVSTADGHNYIVTVQRAEGKSPHALRREAEAERDSLKVELDAMKVKT